MARFSVDLSALTAAARARYEATSLGVDAPAWEELREDHRANHIRLMKVALAAIPDIGLAFEQNDHPS